MGAGFFAGSNGRILTAVHGQLMAWRGGGTQLPHAPRRADRTRCRGHKAMGDEALGDERQARRCKHRRCSDDAHRSFFRSLATSAARGGRRPRNESTRDVAQRTSRFVIYQCVGPQRLRFRNTTRRRGRVQQQIPKTPFGRVRPCDAIPSLWPGGGARPDSEVLTPRCEYSLPLCTA